VSFDQGRVDLRLAIQLERRVPPLLDDAIIWVPRMRVGLGGRVILAPRSSSEPETAKR
jgi:hypothetical protein